MFIPETTSGTVTGNLEVTAQPKSKRASSPGGDELGKEEFLNLLITSLRYQDPLDPSSNEQFISQMAQFSTLENSQNMNSNLERLALSMENMVTEQNKSAQVMSGASATSLLGKVARVSVDGILFNGVNPEKFQVHVEDGRQAVISIVDENDKAINTISVPGSGDHEMTWDGSLPDGGKAPPGNYTIRVTDTSGRQDAGYVYVEETVQGISYKADGVKLDMGGLQVPMENVVKVFESKDVPDDVTDDVSDDVLDNFTKLVEDNN